MLWVHDIMIKALYGVIHNSITNTVLLGHLFECGNCVVKKIFFLDGNTRDVASRFFWYLSENIVLFRAHEYCYVASIHVC